MYIKCFSNVKLISIKQMFALNHFLRDGLTLEDDSTPLLVLKLSWTFKKLTEKRTTSVQQLARFFGIHKRTDKHLASFLTMISRSSCKEGIFLLKIYCSIVILLWVYWIHCLKIPNSRHGVKFGPFLYWIDKDIFYICILKL